MFSHKYIVNLVFPPIFPLCRFEPKFVAPENLDILKTIIFQRESQNLSEKSCEDTSTREKLIYRWRYLFPRQQPGKESKQKQTGMCVEDK